MPVYELPDEIVFPHPSLAEPDGLLAVGGDLSADRLLAAYCNGIFPWYNDGDPILWWSPDPRCVFYPPEIKVSKSLRQSLRNKSFRVSVDTAFEEVIKACAEVKRLHEDGTWIVSDMQRAYIALHEEGFAHSVEVWNEDKLVGGLYGVSVGAAFMGESMFHLERDASKIALYYLSEIAKAFEFKFIDNQMPTDHLLSLGAKTIERSHYLELLIEALESPAKQGKWMF
jgi:leucyl/phenylalanyl-tRNA--protein transferase